jgi:hypothetical protein
MENSPQSARLNGWKEIAAHLGRTVRTVQRWERDLGLPVRRMSTGRGETVFAYVEELDAWLSASEAARARDKEPSEVPEGGTRDAVEREVPEAPSTLEDRNTVAPAKSVAENRAHPPGDRRVKAGNRHTLRPAFVAIALVAVAAFLVIVATRRPGGEGLFGATTRKPATNSLDEQTLTVSDAEGRTLWKYVSPVPLVPNVTIYGEKLEQVFFHDLEGDGSTEVVLHARAREFADNAIYCFEQDGKPRFAWKYLGERHYGGETYAAPWFISRLLVQPDRRRGAGIWVVIQHVPWFPSALIRLDSKGVVTGEFWNDGHINTLKPFRLGDREVFLVGASTNETRSAVLAVVDQENPWGSAPALTPRYSCLDCPAGEPLRYLVFPRTAVSKEANPVSGITHIRVDKAGQSVLTVEHWGLNRPGEAAPSFAPAHYIFDARLEPRSAEFGQGYLLAHRKLYVEGYLKEPLRPGDEKELWPVREWDGNGFAPLPVPTKD